MKYILIFFLLLPPKESATGIEFNTFPVKEGDMYVVRFKMVDGFIPEKDYKLEYTFRSADGMEALNFTIHLKKESHKFFKALDKFK